MEFCDLKSQYLRLKADIDAGIQRVLDHGQYILGQKGSAQDGAQHIDVVRDGLGIFRFR